KKKEDSKKEPGDKKPEKKEEKDKTTPAPKPEAAATKDDEKEKPDLVLWHWMDNRLQAQQQKDEASDKNFNYLCIYRVKEKKFLRLADDKMRTVQAAPKQRWALGYDYSEYELSGLLDGRDFQDVYVIDLETGARRLALQKYLSYAYFRN